MGHVRLLMAVGYRMSVSAKEQSLKDLRMLSTHGTIRPVIDRGGEIRTMMRRFFRRGRFLPTVLTYSHVFHLLTGHLSRNFSKFFSQKPPPRISEIYNYPTVLLSPFLNTRKVSVCF